MRSYLFIYQRTTWTKAKFPLRSRHPSVARTSSFSSSFFPPLLINHTSIRLVNPWIHAPHAPFRVYTIYTVERVIIVGRYRGSTAEFARCHRDEKEVETYISTRIYIYIAYNITIGGKFNGNLFGVGEDVPAGWTPVSPVWFYQANLVGSLSKLNGTH